MVVLISQGDVIHCVLGDFCLVFCAKDKGDVVVDHLIVVIVEILVPQGVVFLCDFGPIEGELVRVIPIFYVVVGIISNLNKEFLDMTKNIPHGGGYSYRRAP